MLDAYPLAPDLGNRMGSVHLQISIRTASIGPSEARNGPAAL